MLKLVQAGTNQLHTGIFWYSDTVNSWCYKVIQSQLDKVIHVRVWHHNSSLTDTQLTNWSQWIAFFVPSALFFFYCCSSVYEASRKKKKNTANTWLTCNFYFRGVKKKKVYSRLKIVPQHVTAFTDAGTAGLTNCVTMAQKHLNIQFYMCFYLWVGQLTWQQRTDLGNGTYSHGCYTLITKTLSCVYILKYYNIMCLVHTMSYFSLYCAVDI